MQTTASRALIAIGANISAEDSSILTTLTGCVEYIHDHTGVFQMSKWYQTPCFPEGSGPDYVNGAIEIAWSGESLKLLNFLHTIEKDRGRVRMKRWGSRPIDLDLIAFDDKISPTLKTWYHWFDLPLDRQMVEAPKELILPHPRMQDRAFVLGPLMDIAPDWRHPILNKTVQQMWLDLPQTDRDQITAI